MLRQGVDFRARARLFLQTDHLNDWQIKTAVDLIHSLALNSTFFRAEKGHDFRRAEALDRRGSAIDAVFGGLGLMQVMYTGDDCYLTN